MLRADCRHGNSPAHDRNVLHEVDPPPIAGAAGAARNA
jgi:hypothetical protein